MLVTFLSSQIGIIPFKSTTLVYKILENIFGGEGVKIKLVSCPIIVWNKALWVDATIARPITARFM
jgi:hypothetical protein